MAEKGLLTGLLCNVNKFPGLVILDFDKRDDDLQDLIKLIRKI